MDDIKFLRLTALVVIGTALVLFLCRSFVQSSAWLSVLIGGGYGVFSLVLYQLVLGSIVRKARNQIVQILIVFFLMPLKLVALLGFAYHLSQQSVAVIAWHLFGLLMFVPVALVLSIQDRGSERLEETQT
jgi:hypothetical protein